MLSSTHDPDRGAKQELDDALTNFASSSHGQEEAQQCADVINDLQVKNPRAFAPLLIKALIETQSNTIQIAACRALGRFGTEAAPAIDELTAIACLNERPDVASEAMKVLAGIKLIKAFRAMLEVIKQVDEADISSGRFKIFCDSLRMHGGYIQSTLGEVRAALSELGNRLLPDVTGPEALLNIRHDIRFAYTEARKAGGQAQAEAALCNKSFQASFKGNRPQVPQQAGTIYPRIRFFNPGYGEAGVEIGHLGNPEHCKYKYLVVISDDKDSAFSYVGDAFTRLAEHVSEELGLDPAKVCWAFKDATDSGPIRTEANYLFWEVRSTNQASIVFKPPTPLPNRDALMAIARSK